MQRKFYYKREALKTLKSMVSMYEDLGENITSYSRADDILDSLNEAIWIIGCSICPKDILSFEDLVEWIIEQ